MKLSSRKQLLKEADRELNKIRLRILLESNGEVDTEKIEKVAQKIADKKTEKIQSKIEKDLEDLKRQSISMQREFEKANRETGISIEEWYKDQPNRNKAIYNIESYTRQPIGDSLWDRIEVAIFSMFPNRIAIDSEGNEYNVKTGERIEKPTGLDPSGASIIRIIIQSLSI